MIHYDKKVGCYYEHETTGKHYQLYEAKVYKHNTTSDRIIIWDEDECRFVNFVYGANSLDIAELDHMVTYYVTKYESKL